MLGNKRFIRKLKVRNLLSFSETGIDLQLESLNVLIGPNASGKSNLIETVALMKSLPSDFAQAVRVCGGINDMLWKGGEKRPIAEVEAIVYCPPPSIRPLRHKISFTKANEKLELIDESIEDEYGTRAGLDDVYFYYRFYMGNPVINVRSNNETQTGLEREPISRKLNREDLLPDQSVLAQRKEPDHYPEVTYLSNNYKRIMLYREWNMGRATLAREPQRTDVNGDFLNEDYSNLSLVLNDLEFKTAVKQDILKRLKTVYDRVEDIKTKTQMGQIQMYIDEGLNEMIPATRLSDGTIRFLCLLVVLCHPTPPSLVCIEEPELGLHPDILPEIGRLLIEASHRTQLIVTTHSPMLIDALGETPEAVVVCENHGKGTEMRRIGKEQLASWLEDYTLGDAWMRGAMGGTRW